MFRPRSMAGSTSQSNSPAPEHSWAFRQRRFLNWFPLGLTYALLYMGRYNLTVAKNSLGELMTKEDFGVIFGAGTFVYAFAFLFNGPLVDRIGGKRGMLIGAFGAMLANVAMAIYLQSVLASGRAADAPLRLVFSILYAANMYFQSYGAVSIVKVNAHWFHVSERGGFSGIFGTMIASGIFLAFTVNDWLLGLAQGFYKEQPKTHSVWVVFAIPGALLGLFFLIEAILLRDRPSQAGHTDFDTGDARTAGDDSDTPIPPLELYKRIFSNRVIMTIALIELCTGVLRNGVMHWYPIYAKEILALPEKHLLRNGSWDNLGMIAVCFAAAAVSAILAKLRTGKQRGILVTLAALAFLAPFVQGGWGGLLMVSGVVGGNVAGWVSDLFFQSRRGPAAAGLYGFLIFCSVAMIFVLSPPRSLVASASKDSGLLPGDRIVAVGSKKDLESWADVRAAIACWEPQCKASQWDVERCICSTTAAARPPISPGRGIPLRVERDGKVIDVILKDPKPLQEAGDLRLLKASPILPMSPWWLGVVVFLVSVCVIGTHGVLSGTATMDFGGRRGAATAVGVIDGFVYLGTAIQSVSLGYLTTRNWSYWPIFLLPFAILGFLFATRIWSAKPRG